MGSQTVTMFGLIASMVIPLVLLGVVFVKSRKRINE